MSTDGLISFARGAPSPDITPPEALRECANRVLQKDAVGALMYGPGTGYGPLRDWIAERHGVDPERVMVTNGSLEARGIRVGTTPTETAQLAAELAGR